MATEQQKYANRARLWGLTVVGMTMGIWEMVEEASVALSPQIGAQILNMLEKQLGLEVAGEKPEHLLVELGRIFVDEYGYASEAKVESTDKTLRVTLENAVGTPEFAMLKERGVEKLFSHPFFCAGLAAFARLGLKARGNVETDVAAKRQVITYELI
jgi:hypothetical protein